LIVKWVQNDLLARAERPGYPAHEVGHEDVRSVVESWRKHGIRCISCLLDWEQLEYYSIAGVDLLDTYSKAGFTDAHLPVPDYEEPPLSPKELADVAQAYTQLPNPVLIHCSAGVDRTGHAIKHSKAQRSVQPSVDTNK
jgi:protein tyrosine phosphatase (PTP) superfamily phosphohydrolase (DUF442 family)